MPQVKDIRLNRYQDEFIFAKERFSALISSVATGKTFSFLFKAWKFCQDNPGALGLIIRKEFTDLRDSTIKDFERYFNVKINQANKEYQFKNGSKIMFRHGDMTDINVLKNINLSFFGIEQAEEYESDEIFDFLRDRLRRQGTARWAMVIANANGHNWLYKRFINGAECTEINSKTGEYIFRKENYVCCTANSFANAHNLPEDFVKDLKAMEIEAPEHYYQYIMNSFEHTEADDFLFSQQEFEPKIPLSAQPEGIRVAGFDVARFGKDSCAFKVLELFGSSRWKEVYSVKWKKQPLTYSCGRVLELCNEWNVQVLAVDGDGLGGGYVDVLRNGRANVIEYRGGLNPDVDYYNNRARDYFLLKDSITKGYIDVIFEETKESLLTIKYMFQNDRQKRIVGKSQMKSQGYASPDDADAFMMAASAIKYVNTSDDEEYSTISLEEYDPFE